MTDDDLADGERMLVPGAHRLIRTLDAQEGPFAGALVSRGGGVAVQTDAASLSGWDGWGYAGAEHVAGPVDVVRRADGHDVLLPWCSERLTTFLGRRSAAGVALSAGEIATLVGSLLRGIDELDGGASTSGGWWLTDEGRPVFVLGEGDTARTGAARVVARLQEGAADRALGRTLAAVHQGLEQPRVASRVREEWERDLFENAAPRPLRREVFAPERARDLAPQRAAFVDEPPAGAAGRFGRLAAAARAHATGMIDRLGSRASVLRTRATGSDDNSTLIAAAPAAPAVVRRERGPRRRRMLVVAGAAAAAVLAVGMLWPSDGGADARTHDPGDATASPPVDDAVPEEPGAAAGAADPTAAPAGETPTPPAAAAAADDDPVTAARVLLATIRACADAGDVGCPDAVAAGASGVVDLLGRVDAARELTVVDEYGDVAVVRLTSTAEDGEAGEPELMLVLVRLNENWLVRDVYGVADQPG
ncbi:hypothetical protein [Microbacterium sp.]|uniref:hypothetical protein n=1 Tax=Microbacterium sp. TaxID=51671 RepID=UPI00281278FE|nr:hypothetical protein [Microbacterium sp.]